MNKISHRVHLLLTAASLAACTLAPAASFYWDQDGNASAVTGSIDNTGIWDTTTSAWRSGSSVGTLGVYGNAVGDQAVFDVNGGSGRTVALNSASTDLNVNKISFTYTTWPSPEYGYTIAPPASGTAKLVLGGTTPTIQVQNWPVRATISAPIAGNSSLTVITGSHSSSTLTLSGTNTFTGPVYVPDGTLRIASLNYVSAGTWTGHLTGSSLGIPTSVAEGTIHLGSGATSGVLYRTGTVAETTDRVVDLAGTTGGARIDNSGANFALKFTSDFTATGAGSKTLTLYTTSGAIEVAGAIPDSAGGATTVEVAGTTAITLSGVSGYTGPTLISSNGGLRVNSIKDLGLASAMGAPTTVTDGTIKLGVTTATKTLSYFGTGDTTNRVLDLSGTTGGATLDMTGASGTLTFTSDLTASGSGAKTLGVTSGSGSWTLALAGAIPDSAGGATSLSLVNWGSASSLYLTGASTYTGTTTIGAWNGGAVYINSIKNVNGGASALGNPAPGNGAISMGNGGFPAALVYTGTGDTTDRVLNLASTTGGVTLNQSGTGLLRFTSDFTATGAGSKTLTLTGSTAGTAEIAGAIVDNSATHKTSVSKTGTGTWALAGANTYTGTTTVSAGTLAVSTLANGGSPSSIGAATSAAASLVLGGGTLQYTGSTAGTDRGFTLTNGTTSTIEVTQVGTNLTLAGASAASSGALTKTGPGTLTLAGASLYTGLTTVAEGTLAYGTNNALASGAVTVNGGTLDLAGYSDTVGAVTLTNGAIAGVGGTLTGTSYAVQSGSVSANLAGSGNLTKTTANTVTLSGDNSYSGTTAVSGGTLVLAGTNTTSSAITIGNGATLQVGSLANLGTSPVYFNAGSTAGNQATLALRYDGSTSIARDAAGNAGGTVDQIAEFNVDRATAGGPLNGTIAWGNGGTLAFNTDRGQLLVTGDNGYGLTMNQALTWNSTNNGTDKPNIVNNAPGLLTLQGNITAQKVNSRSFELTGTGDILVNGTIAGLSFYLNKTGDNTVTLANTVTTTAGVTVAAGTLRLSGSGALATVAPLNVLAGTMDLNGLNASVTTLTLGAGATGTTAAVTTGAGTLTLGNNVAYNGNTNNANGATVSGKLDLGASTRTFTVSNSTAAAHDLTVSADIGGTGGLTKAGAGTLVLTGNNTYAGNSTINAGVLQVYSAANLGTGSVVINAGSTEGNKATLALRADGDATFAKDALGTADQIAEFNVDRATAGGPLGGTLTWGNGGTMTFNNDRGQLLVTGDNGYGLTFAQSFSWAGNNQTNKPNIVNNAPGLLTIQGNLIGQSINNRSFELTGTGDILVSGNVSGGGYHLLKTGGNTVTFTGTITFPASNCSGFIVREGTLELGGAATFSPSYPVTVSAGTFALDGVNATITTLNLGGGAAGTTATVTTNTGTLTVSGTTTYNGHVANDAGATVSGLLAFTAGANHNITVNNSTAVVNDLSIAADMSGGDVANPWRKAGAGTLSLSGSNTFTMPTYVDAGVLRLDSANALPGGIGTTGGTSFLLINGGIVGLGAGDFTRPLTTGSDIDKVRFYGSTSGGWAAYGADRTVNLGGAGAGVTWGSGGFVAGALILGTAEATHTLEFQNPIALGSAVRTVQVNDGAAAVDARLSGAISGTTTGNGFTKTGTGTLVLSANNSYTGPTNVNQGALRVNGSLASTTVSVAAGATLGGSGTLAGVLNVADGGTLAPGSSAGTLTVGGLLLSDASLLNFELGATGVMGGGVNDLVVVNGDFTLDGILNVTQLAGFGPQPGEVPGVYTLFTYSGGTFTDNGLAIGSFGPNTSGWVGTVDNSVAGLVTLSVIPEPGGLALLGLAAAAAALGRRRDPVRCARGQG